MELIEYIDKNKEIVAKEAKQICKIFLTQHMFTIKYRVLNNKSFVYLQARAKKKNAFFLNFLEIFYKKKKNNLRKHLPLKMCSEVYTYPISFKAI